MTDPSIPVDEQPLDPVLAGIVVRLADEGIPVRAIARATKVESECIRDTLHTAIDLGQLVGMLRDDWPVKVLRDQRIPELVGLPKMDEEKTIFHIARLFKITKLQAAIFAVLIKRTEVLKDTLHQVIESRRRPNNVETDPKMVDVEICHIRKKLKLPPFEITIETQWASGYYMTLEMRKKAHLLLEQFVASLSRPVATDG
jgi:hypothetical protein